VTLIEVIDASRAILNEPLDSSRTFPDNTSSFWGDTILTTYHNLIQSEIQNDVIQGFEDYFMTEAFLNISAGTVEYDLPTNFVKMRRVEDVRDANRAPEIIPITLNDKNNRPTSFIVSGTFVNSGYFIKGNSLVFTDTPTRTQDSAIKLWYIKNLADVTAATATSEIPPEHHQILVWGVVKYALQQQQSDNNFAVGEYEKQLNKMRKQVEQRQIQRPRQVKRLRDRRPL